MAHREFNDWLKAYMEYAGKISETPYEMLYWAGVSAIAGALQRKVWIDEKRYTLYPNFFIVFVADPGVIQKSTTINMAIGLLKNVKGIILAPDATTWEGFIKFMEDNHQSDDTFNAENFLDQSQHKTSAITISASELSTFLDPTNKYMLSALTKLWDCEDVFIKLTKFSGTEHIEKPCLNLIGGTTPAWMRDSFDKWSREGGFVSRTIFIFADTKRQLLAFPSRNFTKEDEQKKDRLTADLSAITAIRGQYKLSEEAYTIGELWYKEHNAKIKQAGYLDSSGFKDRKQAHVLKLSMVIAASRGERMEITPEIWREAVLRIDEAELNFPKAFSTLDERMELRPYYELKEAIKLEKEIDRQRLYSRYTKKYLLREMQAAIEALVESGDISKINKTDGRTMLKWIGDA